MEYFQGAYLSENTIRFGIFNNSNLVFKTYSSNNSFFKKNKVTEKRNSAYTLAWNDYL